MKFTEEELKKMVYKNHEFLSRKAPAILQTISSCQTPFSIKVDEEGRVDADLGGGLIYGGDAYEASLSQVKAFEEKPVRLFPDMQGHKRDLGGELIAHRYSDELLKRVEDRIEPKPLKETGYIPLLLMVGLGFGFHLRALLEKYEVQNLVILDVPAFFRLSIYTLDWEWLLNYYSLPGRRLEMIVQDKLIRESNLDNAFSDLLRVVQQVNPGVFYWGYYFEHLRYNPPMKVIEWFNSSPAFQELFHGYFDDELWSLHWTLEKFEKKIPLYYPQKKVPKGSVAFVLGAGPSLDPAIEKIKEYQDRAVIFSCGSTISALQRAGIVPDFHVEIERTKFTYDALIEVDRQFLKKTRLIANNPLWTDCFKLFKKGYMFLKLNDTGALL
ncbi:MAG: 6-hydroxymethylpterin diphosphokinase MptE-like protein [Aquificaceae bacterium]